ncbi:MAG TPA: CYTH domain-containing protein [Flavobacteriaceae bacterium]|nr:CYTH domain-containing protein [Flavobacteriaceae bacterium]HIP26857.1 CYTH domain-containing protein [Flavobacteriaceae bacterium]
MAIEVERKFLVKGDYKEFVIKKEEIVQGFLSTVPERTVRVRIKKDKAFLTIKGIGNKKGTTRYEFEKEIDIDDAKDLLKICEKGVIEKIRHIIPIENDLFFEVDEFYGDNEGLILAEIELPTENAKFEKPDWLGEEVTGDKRYYNSVLKKNPYKNWK